MERFYTSIAAPHGSLAHWMVGSAVQFRYVGPETDLTFRIQQAWMAMRHRFPAIASTIDMQDGLLTYESPNAVALQHWLNQTLIVHQNKTVDEVFASFRSVPLMTLHFFPQTSQLLVQALHRFIDGRGTLFFWDAFFAALEKPIELKWGDEIKNLTPSEDEILTVKNQSINDDALRAAEHVLAGLQVQEPIGMPSVDFRVPPGNSRRRERKLSASITSKIITACHDRGITVTSAWHATLASVVEQLQTAAGVDGETFASFSNFDIRPWIGTSATGRSHEVGCYHCAWPLSITIKNRSFDDISGELSRKYKSLLSDALADTERLQAYAYLAGRAFASTPPPSSTPVLSSLGVVDRFLRHSFGSEWELTEYWLADTMLTAEIEAFMWTWRGCLVFSGSYNENYYKIEVVDAWLEKLEQKMVENLGLV
jgi:hypothetical protein